MITITKDDFAQKLKYLRKCNDLTQKQVAELINRPQQTIASWETAKSQPDANTLGILFNLYHCSPNSFFEYVTETPEQVLSPREIELALAYRQASEDDKSVVEITLRKYMTLEQQETASAG